MAWDPNNSKQRALVLNLERQYAYYQTPGLHMSAQRIPPGLGDKLEHYNSGGETGDWLPLCPIKYFTCAYILQDDKVLLGYKKRGFGEGIYNGFGGKVEPGETSLQAAHRELEEEAGIKANLKHIGVLLFAVDGAEQTWHIDMYYAESYQGMVTETDEMRPEWFSLSPSGDDSGLPPIPYDKMWASDRYWIPLLRQRKPYFGRADFFKNEDGSWKLKKWWYGEAKE